MKKLIIVWLTPFSLFEHAGLLKIDKTKFLNHHPVPWIKIMVKEIERYEDIELHIISTNKLIKNDEDYNVAGVNYHILKRGIPFIHKGYPNYFRLDTYTNYYWITKKILRKIRQIKPDVINAFGTENEFSLPLKHIDIPSIITIQGLIHNMLSENRSYFYRKQAKLEIDIIKNQKHFITHNSKFINRLILEINPKAQVYPITLPVDDKTFEIGEKDLVKDTDIVFAGGILKSKGVEDLLEAVKILKLSFQNIRVKIMGRSYDHYFKFIENKIKSSGLEENVQLIGFVQESEKMYEEIRKSKVFVLPTYFDTGPRSVAESMALGVPVVSYNVDGLPDMINSGTTGYLVEKGNIEQLAQTILFLLQSDKIRLEVALAAQKYAKEHFLVRNGITKLLDLYRKLLNM